MTTTVAGTLITRVERNQTESTFAMTKEDFCRLLGLTDEDRLVIRDVEGVERSPLFVADIEHITVTRIATEVKVDRVTTTNDNEESHS